MAQNPNFHHPHPADPRQRVSTHYAQPPSSPHQSYPHHLPSPPWPQGYGDPTAASPVPPDPSGYGAMPRRSRGAAAPYVLAGSSMVALAALVVTPAMDNAPDAVSTPASDVCIKQIDNQSLISRDELKQVLDLAPSVSQASVQAIVQQPHCVLEPRTGENDVQVERQAYPLEFDPQTWFVLLYRDGNYAGYDFSFR
jgi:hypothetical protein